MLYFKPPEQHQYVTHGGKFAIGQKLPALFGKTPRKVHNKTVLI